MSVRDADYTSMEMKNRVEIVIREPYYTIPTYRPFLLSILNPSGSSLHNMEPVEMREHLPDILAVIIQTSSIVGLFESFVWITTSHVSVTN